MTDRLAGFIVTLERDMRCDDAAHTVAAIEQIKGVLHVDPLVSDPAQHMAEVRVRQELGDQLWGVLYPKS